MALISILRFLGEIDESDGDVANAHNHRQLSLDLARACALPREVAQTQQEIAELYLNHGTREEAYELLADARSVCDELGARPALKRVDQLLSRSLSRGAEDRFGLMQRELEVLSFLLQGKSDRQIADALYISPRTVMRHVSNILGKLDVDSRTAEAAKAVCHGLG